MADITMCANKKCKLRKKCYRFMARPNPSGWQSYADYKPEKDGYCKDFYRRGK